MCLRSTGDVQDAAGTSKCPGTTLCTLKGSGVPALPPQCTWGSCKDQLAAGYETELLFPEANGSCKL